MLVSRINKKEESVCFMYYNLARVHQAFRVAPAMEAGITEHA